MGQSFIFSKNISGTPSQSRLLARPSIKFSITQGIKIEIKCIPVFKIKNLFSYQQNVDRYSEMWKRSQERSGFEEAIYWIELLIKFKNFDHLKINDGHLNLIQYFCIDVFFLYFVILLTTLVFLIKLARKLMFSRVNKEVKSKLS